MRIDPKSRFVSRFISKLQRSIQDALIESGMKQQEVADKIGVNRSVINRRLSGDANLTARSIAEFAYAFNKDLEVKFVSRTVPPGTNISPHMPHAAIPKIVMGSVTIQQNSNSSAVEGAENRNQTRFLATSVG